MKKLVLCSSIVFIVHAFTWADNAPPPAAPSAPVQGAPTAPPPAGGSNAGAGQPCRQIEQACRAAGFTRGEAAQGKGLFKDCLQPIMHGQSVNGVTVDPSVVSACKERMAKRRAQRQANQGAGQGGSQEGGNGKPDSSPDAGSGSNGGNDSDNSSGQ